MANSKESHSNQIVSHTFASNVCGFHQNDIALIELTHNLEFDELVQPICLGDKVPEKTDMCIIAGWIKKAGEGKIFFQYCLQIIKNYNERLQGTYFLYKLHGRNLNSVCKQKQK